MGKPTEPFALLSISLFLVIFSGFSPSATKAADNTNLVYKGCAAQNFQDPTGIYSQNLKTLLASLVTQSGQKGFSSTTSGQGQNAILGLYQCRGDLTNSDCYNCVSKIPDMVDKLCGNSIASRIQLSGCYLRYEIVGFKQVSGTQLLYKVCGKTKASGTGFEERRDSAFGMVENGVKSGGNLFYTGSYESVYVLGQCEGDLSSNDCGDCVNSAEERAKAECGDSISGQIYLHKCYISYSYYPNGVPSITSYSSSGTKQHTQKTVAIAVGGFAALGFVIVCLLFLKSVMKKRGGKH
ncbi:Cysteine-rich repeat secretory protein like [Quillaja saponaria]|uniref:Cysteine-rich repeat secretory protein like n=1 Tax=Quillaja saponaria TaxID=32244 RepID=A0AAD7Q914_QUISA|nr:Cysteine-rich repeat secretory protein like [Quillaja saponaria]